MMPGLQEWIHKIEEGEGAKYVRVAFFVLALLGLTAVWHLREARAFASIEAMDSAQVARNIAEGKGFSTDCVRPFSIALVEKRRGEGSVLKDPHPDLANAPVYPLLLAGLMKVLPFNWAIDTGTYWRYQPEVLIGWFNQCLFFLAMFLVFRLGAKLFDRSVGALAMALMALTEIFWEFTTSGLSTIFLIDLLLALVYVLVSMEQGLREGGKSKAWTLSMALAAGLITAIMMLTRYSMGWLIIPVIGFLAAFAATLRAPATLAAIMGFALVVSPWIFRNYQASGHLFGIAGYAIHEGSDVFPGHLLERSMPKNITLELNKIDMDQYLKKLFVNGRDILERDLPESAGNWIAALFIGALLVPYRNPSLGRLKLLTVAAVLVLLVVQAFGRTAYSEHSPKYNSENLLVIISPIFFVFGCAFFYTLLDQIVLPLPWMRSAIISCAVLVLSLPLIFRLMPPRNVPSVYPPYFPPIIQTAARWMEKNELIMSDMPWAVAWYGQRQCVWATLDVGDKQTGDFYHINDDHKILKGIYLTPLTTNAKFLTEMRRSREGVWAKFYLEAVVMNNLPKGFPLKFAQPGWLPDQIFISDRIRWHE